MKLFIAGHNGMVGSALVRRYAREPGVTVVTRGKRELDLTNQAQVEAFYAAEKPDVVFVAAARVGWPVRTSLMMRPSTESRCGSVAPAAASTDS